MDNNTNRTIKYNRIRRIWALLFIPIMAAPLISYYFFWTESTLITLIGYAVQLFFMYFPFTYQAAWDPLDRKKTTIAIDASEIDKYVALEQKAVNVYIALTLIVAVIDIAPLFQYIFMRLGFKLWIILLLYLPPIIMVLLDWVYIRLIKRESTDLFEIKKNYDETGRTPTEELLERKRIANEKRNEMIMAEIQKYGEGYQILDKELRLYYNENLQKLFYKDKSYDFKDILAFNFHDNITVKTTPVVTTTTSEDTIGRYVLRPPINGSNVGVFVGQPSSPTVVETTGGERYEIHNYIMYITINDLNEPVLTIDVGRNYDLLNRLRAVLTVIVSRNKG